MLPAMSVWSVAVSPDGDIIAGSSDGIIRVFTRNPEKHASAENLKVLCFFTRNNNNNIREEQ